MKFKVYNRIVERFQLTTLEEIYNTKLVQFQNVVFLRYTGFKDKNGTEIYEGDILSELVEIDGVMTKTKQRVFWNDKQGCWNIDESFKQDKSIGYPLWKALEISKLNIVGNINRFKKQVEV